MELKSQRSQLLNENQPVVGHCRSKHRGVVASPQDFGQNEVRPKESPHVEQPKQCQQLILKKFKYIQIRQETWAF